ncbi:MAG TPA: acid phosphatase [Polyangia bacterium]|nr:acid phosphatase [Polyangia bacterium]
MAQPTAGADMTAPTVGADMTLGPDMTSFDEDTALKAKVKNVVVIYMENRSFDSIFGTFPGANGIPGVNATAKGTIAPQTDRDANNTVLAKLPEAYDGVTVSGQTPVFTAADSDNKPNAPYSIEATYAGVDYHEVTTDMYHRFFENQMQIHGGANDKFTAYADEGGMVMAYFDISKTSLWALAKQYVLADNFYMGAFGGSFLNHQYLICGCAPEFPGADTALDAPSFATLDKDANGNFTPSLTINTATSPASALDGKVVFVTTGGSVTPLNYFGDGKYYAINTTQPPYQPSSIAPAAADTTLLYANPAPTPATGAIRSPPLPPQTATTIGDTLDAATVAWKFYGGAWKLATMTTTQAGHPTPTSGVNVAPTFQYHHYPFNYYAKFDPVNAATYRAAHLQDYTDMVSDAAAGTLPAVSFYKPEGDLNQHSGYASIAAGDASLGDLVTKLQASPQWKNMVIVITYDENGGIWDHVAPPKGDLLGPGTRIPAVIISPYAKMGTIDHTQYDTGSIARFITRRFGLTPLAGITARDQALVKNGGTAMGDLTAALDLTK